MIINIALLQLSLEDEMKLQAGALMHRKMSNIKFKIKSVSEKGIIIITKQDKHLSGNYGTQLQLRKTTKELFSTVLPNTPMLIHAKPYTKKR